MTRALRLAGRLLDLLISACAVAAVLILVALAAGVSFEVVMRYFAGRPTRWVNEFSEYALLWLAFLSGAWVLRSEAHVRVELLTDSLSPLWQQRFHFVTSLVGAAVCALFCWVSTQYLIGIYASGEVLFKSIIVPKWAIMAVIPPCLALLAIEFVRRAFRGPPGPTAVGL
jgi:TRAP-type C4-dicarboxylate transport system permease small subunit